MSVEQSVSTAAAIGLAARGNMIRNLSNTSSPMTMRDLEKSQQIRFREPHWRLVARHESLTIFLEV